MTDTATALGPGGRGLDTLTAAGVSVRHPLVRPLFVLTLTTGLVDATSYLGLGHVFTANQTGNTVLLAVGIAGAANLPVLAPLVSLGAFFLAAVDGGLVIRPQKTATSNLSPTRLRSRYR
jgi:uncharacterized membrane protein YoaK (UPF0700 family)